MGGMARPRRLFSGRAVGWAEKGLESISVKWRVWQETYLLLWRDTHPVLGDSG